MDLACPHCDARYRVLETSVPPEGRMIRCAKCGGSWHQDHRAQAIADPEPMGAGIPDIGVDMGGLAMSAVAFGPARDAESYNGARSRGIGNLWPLLIVLAAAGAAFGYGLYTGQIALP